MTRYHPNVDALIDDLIEDHAQTTGLRDLDPDEVLFEAFELREDEDPDDIELRLFDPFHLTIEDMSRIGLR